MEKYYRFAGVEVSVCIPDKWMYEDERQLAPFRAAQVKDPHTFHFELVEVLSPPSGRLEIHLPGMRVYREGEACVRYIGTVEDGWEKAYIRVAREKNESYVQVTTSEFITNVSVKTILNSMEAEHLVAAVDGFLFHCSYIDHNGKAILFTAPSETGKSTRAERWHQHRGAEIINGDRAAVRLVDGVLMAEGIPFAGSSQYCKNRSLPIEAIVYLGQAPETSIRKMRGYEAFSKIWEGVSVNTWDKEDMERVSHVVQKAAEQVPIFYLPCTPDESAVIALEEALRKLVKA